MAIVIRVELDQCAELVKLIVSACLQIDLCKARVVYNVRSVHLYMEQEFDWTVC